MTRDCASLLTDRMTQAEKAQLIHDYMLWRMDYAYDDNGEPVDTAWAHSIIGGAVNKRGVCESYAKVFQYLCLLNDVPCLFAVGSYGDSPHAWNYFQAEGVWYGADVCFDDGAATPCYQFFGCSERGITYDRHPKQAGKYWYELPELSQEKLILSNAHILPLFTEIPESYFHAADIMTRVYIPNTVTCINRFAFSGGKRLKCVTVPVTVTEIGWLAYSRNEAMTDIYYGGTKEQWAAISFGEEWDFETGDYTVHCTDGDIRKGH